ncbi:hypothetical protein Ocin01_12085 [Orchesella cincta]|uniref:Uncharacterized protein n=1 Tax=Orchesella cincta TaxID=48709 RepID=A0A1D2MNE8_ORCCI|nr:hypothetical protein Ocin01_12085 [Orchesella cincta]
MGNGQFGMYFIGSGPPGSRGDDAITSSSSKNHTVPRDYERVLYKTGRFPHEYSKSPSPTNTPKACTTAPSNSRVSCDGGPLLATRPLSFFTQRYDSNTSLGKGNASTFPMGRRNLGISYNRVFRHRDDFQLNYKENYSSGVCKPLFPYPGYATHIPCSYGSEDFGGSELNTTNYGGCLTSTYLTSGGNALKCMTDNFTSSICDSETSPNPISTLMSSSVGTSFTRNLKGCQTDPAPWILSTKSRNEKLMVVTPNSRFGKPQPTPPTINGTSQPQVNKSVANGKTKGAQTNPGSPVDDLNPSFPYGHNDLVESFPFDPYGNGVPGDNTGPGTTAAKTGPANNSQGKTPGNITNKPSGPVKPVGVVKPIVSSSKSTGPGNSGGYIFPGYTSPGGPGSDTNMGPSKPGGNGVPRNTNKNNQHGGPDFSSGNNGSGVTPNGGGSNVPSGGNNGPGAIPIASGSNIPSGGNNGPGAMPIGSGSNVPRSGNNGPGSMPIGSGSNIPRGGNNGSGVTPNGSGSNVPRGGNNGPGATPYENGVPNPSNEKHGLGTPLRNNVPGTGPGGKPTGQIQPVPASGNYAPVGNTASGSPIGNSAPESTNGPTVPRKPLGNGPYGSKSGTSLPQKSFGNKEPANSSGGNRIPPTGNNVPTNPAGSGVAVSQSVAGIPANNSPQPPPNAGNQRKPSTFKAGRETPPRSPQSTPSSKDNNAPPKRKSTKGLFRSNVVDGGKEEPKSGLNRPPKSESTNNSQRSSNAGSPNPGFGSPRGSKAHVPSSAVNGSKTRNNLPVGTKGNEGPAGLGIGSSSSPNLGYNQPGFGDRNPNLAAKPFNQSQNPPQNGVMQSPPTKLTSASGGLQNGSSRGNGAGYPPAATGGGTPLKSTTHPQNNGGQQPQQPATSGNGPPTGYGSSPTPYSQVPVPKPSIAKGVQTEVNTNPVPENTTTGSPPPTAVQNPPIYTAKKLEGDESPPYFTPSPLQQKKFRNELPARNIHTASSSGSSPERTLPPPVTTTDPPKQHWKIPWGGSGGSSPERGNTPTKDGGAGGSNTTPNNVTRQAPKPLPASPVVNVIAPPPNSSVAKSQQPTALKRYPSQQGPSKDGPVFMARKQSVNQLKESMSRQGGGPKPVKPSSLQVPASQKGPPAVNRSTVGGVLTIPSVLSLTKLRQGEIKIARPSVVKREMAEDEENYVTLPKGNKSRMGLVSALKKPPVSNSTRPSTNAPKAPVGNEAGVRKSRSVHFKGVPPTP